MNTQAYLPRFGASWIAALERCSRQSMLVCVSFLIIRNDSSNTASCCEPFATAPRVEKVPQQTNCTPGFHHEEKMSQILRHPFKLAGVNLCTDNISVCSHVCKSGCSSLAQTRTCWHQKRHNEKIKVDNKENHVIDLLLTVNRETPFDRAGGIFSVALLPTNYSLFHKATSSSSSPSCSPGPNSSFSAPGHSPSKLWHHLLPCNKRWPLQPPSSLPIFQPPSWQLSSKTIMNMEQSMLPLALPLPEESWLF